MFFHNKGQIFVSSQVISSSKQNHKKNAFGLYYNELDRLKQYINSELPSKLTVIQKIESYSIFEIENKANFCLILINKENIQECKDEIFTGTVNIDGVLKLE